MPTMTSLYGDTAAPSRGSGVVGNGFILFGGASIGPGTGGAVTSLSALTAVLAALLGLAAASALGFSAPSREKA